MSITRADLDSLLADLRAHRGDSTGVEVKRAAHGMPADIGSTLCAFANMPDGGLIILGVSEADGFSTTGVDNPAAMEAGLASIARQSVVPAPYIETASIDHDGLWVITCRVAALPPSAKPARFRGEAYLRQGDGDYVMGPADLRMIDVAGFHERERLEYDAADVPGASRADLDDDLVEELIGRARRSSARLRQLDDDVILRQLGATTTDGTPSVAGLYALGNFPQGVMPALRVTAAVQLPRDGSGVRTQNLRVFDGPVSDLLASTLEWVTANLTTRQVYGADGNLRSVLELPLRAVREAVANALVHRDLGPDTLGMGRSVDVRLSENALTIASPGGLRGVTLRQIMGSSHARAAVNQRLYALAQYMRTEDGSNIIEGEGGGVTEILRSTVDADLRRPRLVDSGVTFTTILWRGAVVDPADERWLIEHADGRALTHLQKQVLLRARDGRAWSIDGLSEEFSPMSRGEAHEQLARLVRWGLISVDLTEEMPVSLSPRAGGIAVPHTPAGSRKVHRSNDRSLGKNGPSVLGAIDGETSLAQIKERTALTDRQVRYAVKTLEAAGLVTMNGGPGQRGTTYTRNGDAESTAHE
ncbi:ATP-binding protein [Brachybacterium sp. AOP29-B2-41]|uniref:ATP-binding protein n=1 Tax=Brachybacterium sp. AOP29-B2-41 TaxID=3457704 RepID=UPI004034C6BC